ncbi:MAG: CRTAC1 family protein [Thalassotalea sp.]|nr:CRTAC1 family protein [Thalassotalea sp.]
MKVHTQLKNFTILAIISCITSCGGSGDSSKKPVATNDTVIDDKIIGEPVAIIYANAQTSDTNQCHASSVDNDVLMFSEISEQAGLNFSHSMPNGDGILGMSGGVAAGDFNSDGWPDLYAIGGEGQENLLLINQQDGSFKDDANFANVDLLNRGSGPSFADINGDGLLDLFVGSVGGAKPRLFINTGNEKFSDITEQSGLNLPTNNFSATWADYDKDNDLDLFITHYDDGTFEHYPYFWRNNGDLTFTDVSLAAGIDKLSIRDRTFTPNFADINNDSWQDLLLVTDNNLTKVFLNNQDGTFKDFTNTDVITDNAGMGSAIGDYDNDGDLDWFVSAISFKDGVKHFGWLTPGNRFYQNQGDGTFIDKTDETGVRHGYWGWGSCFSDFNNDGHLDIFHVNGMEGEGIEPMFKDDPSRLFMANGDGTFTESALAAGIDDKAMGRGLVCFDYDKDGDQDLYIANHNQPPKLFCNQGTNNNFINIRLVEKTTNTQAIGARIYVKTEASRQMRELRTGNNFVSQNPVEAHFGLNTETSIEYVRIIWPDGKETKITDVSSNQFLIIERI